jgi:alkylation response protein AidB-like acyl-CoA dehydrogenase
MNMNFTAVQKMIMNTASKVSCENLEPIAKDMDRELKFPREGLNRLAEKEFMGLCVPEALGGAGADTLSFVLATEAIAKGCPSTALIYLTHSVAARAVVVGGTDELKEKLLPGMISGEKLGAFASTEPNSGANPFAVSTNAKTDGDEFIVNGSKTFITSAKEADAYVVVLKTDKAQNPANLTALMVEKDTPGFTFGNIEDNMGLRGTSDGELFFEDCRVPKSNLIGEENGYLDIMPKFIGLGFVGVSAISIGIAQAAFEASKQHAMTREIAGQAIGNYQGIQFMLAEMNTSIEAARNFTYNVATTLDGPPTGPPLPLYSSKLFATEMALDVTQKALQIHGGHGYSREMPLERYYRDARGLTLHFSPTEMLKGMMGKMLMSMPPF